MFTSFDHIFSRGLPRKRTCIFKWCLDPHNLSHNSFLFQGLEMLLFPQPHRETRAAYYDTCGYVNLTRLKQEWKIGPFFVCRIVPTSKYTTNLHSQQIIDPETRREYKPEEQDRLYPDEIDRLTKNVPWICIVGGFLSSKGRCSQYSWNASERPSPGVVSIRKTRLQILRNKVRFAKLFSKKAARTNQDP